MDPADPCGNPPGPHRALCIITFFDLINGIHGVQEMQVSVMMTHDVESVHRLLSGALKLELRGHHGSGVGDVAQPQTL